MFCNFSKNLKYLRKINDISQQELADNLGLDRSSISKWENGLMDVTIGNAIKISNYFNIPLGDFVSKNISEENNKKENVSAW